MRSELNENSVSGTWTVDALQRVTYTVKNSTNLLSKANHDLLEHGSQGQGARRMVVIDRNICRWYLIDVVEYFQSQGVQAHVLAVDATEDKKDIELLSLILREMEHFGLLRRDEPLIAIGGGGLLDVAGMAAGLYRRGVPYVRVPTTLVGLVDASIGAKTGINFDNRRNRLGSYYPPIASYLDRAFLTTLPEIELSSGLGEILKMAVVKDYDLFLLLESHGGALIDTGFSSSVADEVINRAVDGMLVELEANLWETTLRRLVDFGHSFSPIPEMRSIHDAGQEPLTHGQAVSLDVQFSSVLSHLRGMLNYDDLIRIVRVAKAMLLPSNHDLFRSPLVLLEALNDTVRHRNGHQNLPFPCRIGEAVFVDDVTYDEIKAGVEFMANLDSDGHGSLTPTLSIPDEAPGHLN